MIEIKNCPFCGSTARLKEKIKTYYKGEQTYNTYVYCPNCGSRGRRAILSHFPTNRKAREHVIEAWNQRVELEALLHGFHAPEMSFEVLEMNPEVTKWLEKVAEKGE